MASHFHCEKRLYHIVLNLMINADPKIHSNQTDYEQFYQTFCNKKNNLNLLKSSKQANLLIFSPLEKIAR